MYPHEFGSAQNAFEFLFDTIMRSGRIKGDGTKAINNINFELTHPDRNEIKTPWRKWSKEYADLEWEWYLTGNRNPALVEERAKLWKKMKDEEGLVWSNYGHWWQLNNQFNNAIELIRTNPLTRRAFIAHYDPNIPIKAYEKDTPCNLILNLYQIQGDLNLTVFARSIDLVFGFCNDQYCFSMLLMNAAKLLRCHLGSLHFMITDLHIYERDWNRKLNYQTNG